MARKRHIDIGDDMVTDLPSRLDLSHHIERLNRRVKHLESAYARSIARRDAEIRHLQDEVSAEIVKKNIAYRMLRKVNDGLFKLVRHYIEVRTAYDDQKQVKSLPAIWVASRVIDIINCMAGEGNPVPSELLMDKTRVKNLYSIAAKVPRPDTDPIYPHLYKECGEETGE